MDFYQLWQETRKMGLDDYNFFVEYLNSSEKSRKTLISGTDDEVINAIELLASIPLDDFIFNIRKLKVYDIESQDIIQFSNYNHAIIDLLNVLLAKNDGLTFDEIGYRLMGAKTGLAQKKYGENHAKLALTCDFVSLNKQIAYIVNLTSLGKNIVRFDEKYIRNVALRLIIRNHFILNALVLLLSGEKYDYKKSCSGILSEKTMIRRRSNVKYVINEILNNSTYYELTNSIVW